MSQTQNSLPTSTATINSNTPLPISSSHVQDTYFRRYLSFFPVVNPLNGLRGFDLDYYQKIVKNGTADPLLLRKAQDVINTSTHPDTKEIIPAVFRMCFFIPFNMILTLGLIYPHPSAPLRAGIHSINQLYNVGLDYANRNASNSRSTSDIIKSGFYATTLSSMIAVGVGHLMSKPLATTSLLTTFLYRFMPSAVALTSCHALDIIWVRSDEYLKGINVSDVDGNVVGKSQIAGWQAVKMTLISRVTNALAVLAVPSLSLALIEKNTNFIKRHPRLAIPLELGLIGATLCGILPATLALFPQRYPIHVHKLEPHFHDLQGEGGKKVDVVYFNKGL